MSTPSKKRRQARAWMAKERLRSEVAIAINRHDYERRILELTRVVTPGDMEGQVWPQSPEGVRPIFSVYARQPLWDASDSVRFGFESRTMPINAVAEVYHLRPIQMALPLPDGRSVRWIAWEMSGGPRAVGASPDRVRFEALRT